MELKIEFDIYEEYQKAMDHLEDYHDCEKCHGKIVCIRADLVGNTYCSYCGMMVKYPSMTKKCFEELLKERENGN